MLNRVIFYPNESITIIVYDVDEVIISILRQIPSKKSDNVL